MSSAFLFWLLWFGNTFMVAFFFYKIGRIQQKRSVLKWSTGYLEGMKKNVFGTLHDHVTDDKKMTKAEKEKHAREHIIDASVQLGEVRVLSKMVKDL